MFARAFSFQPTNLTLSARKKKIEIHSIHPSRRVLQSLLGQTACPLHNKQEKVANTRMAGGYEDDDDGFVGYVPSTVDLGGSLLVGSVFAFLIGYMMILPTLVVWTRQREARRKAANKTFPLDDAEDKSPENQGEEELIVDSVDAAHIRDDNSITKANADGSVAGSTATSRSVISNAIEAILDHPQVPKTKSGRKRRRMKEAEVAKSKWSGKSASGDEMDVTSVTLLQGIYPGGYKEGGVTLGDPKGPASEYSSNSEDEGAFVNLAGTTRIPPPKYAEDFNGLGSLDKIAFIAASDVEMKRIMRLSAPYCTQALITGLTDVMNVAIIGKLIGTKEVSAYVIVNLLVELTSEFVGGLHEALATLCSQAIGANNKKLAGQYVQIVVILYTIFFIPFMLIWAAYMDAALRWMGFDEETVSIGRSYNYILIVDLLMDGLGEAVHGLLDVGGHEKFSTVIGASEEVAATMTLLFVALSSKPDLVTVGLIQFGIGMLFLTLNVWIILRKGENLIGGDGATLQLVSLN